MARHFRRNIQRPSIGITGNSKRFSPSWICLRFAVWLAGGSPIRIQVGDRIDHTALAGLIISGGDDIHPTLYGEKADAGKFYDKKRDALEIECILYAVKAGIPILGICRGHQLINTVLGGSLYPDITSLRLKTRNNLSLLPNKLVVLDPASKMKDITGTTQLRVNSLHSQAIERLAADLKPVAVDRDDFIQGVETAD